MDANRRIGERVLELLEEIDLEQPLADEELVTDRVGAYVAALGAEDTNVRFHPDVRAMRAARVRPEGQDRAHWAGFTSREYWLLERPFRSGWRWSGGDWAMQGQRLAPRTPELERLREVDRIVLRAGLGWCDDVRGVRSVIDSLEDIARMVVARPAEAPRRVEALVPLAEAAAAGLFAYAVGYCRGVDLTVLVRPRIRFDTDGRLHEWDGLPAAEWPNGKGVYFWHGVHMTESAGRDPDAITASRVLRWANAERRRVAIERMGLERFMQAVGAEVIQEDDYGRLWRANREVEGESFVAVEVVNSTPDPDGSYRRYFLRVPPSMRSARRAVAWSFGLTKVRYAPVMES